MTTPEIIAYIIAGLGGIVSYLFKTQLDDLKNADKDHRDEIKHIKDNYFKRADFTEFKLELWDRLDRFEADVKRQLEK